MQYEETAPGGSWRCISGFCMLLFSFAMNPTQFILILLVRVYRVSLSPVKTFLFGSAAQCRFEPSCSQYAIDALKMHGAVAGSWLATKRVCRCHPWGGCGKDPVPPKKSRVQSPASRVDADFNAPSEVRI